LSFWEPGAPPYEERLKALKIAKERGFGTSVSVEPMLDADNISKLIEDLKPHVTDSIWLGTLSEIDRWVKIDSDDEAGKIEVEKVKTRQAPEKLIEIYDKHKNDPIIKWKGHVREALKSVGVQVPNRKDDWRDRLKA
jgi:DNA repair photolyase